MKKPSRWTAVYVILILAGIAAAAWLGQNGLHWLLVAIALLLLLAVLGWQVTDRPSGLLIDERNLFSLARFQLVVWTIIILSGYLLIVAGRIKAGLEDPLAVAIDWRLWSLMGISTASLVGSPLISNSKKKEEPTDKAITKAAASLEEDPAEIKKNKEGILYSNTAITDARFADMFQGDEVQNTGHLDVAKVQMFVFTLIAAVAYSGALWTMFGQSAAAPGGIESMPAPSEGLIALLGISHVGYLSSKGISHTDTVK
jgi:hypothetical protein